MIAKKLEGALDAMSWKTLETDSRKFKWGQKYDGPTMLWLLLVCLKPSTRVHVSAQKAFIQSARLPQFIHNVKEMLDKMAYNYKYIIERGFTHEDYLLHLFVALGSGKNEKFTNFISGLQSDWETGDEAITADILIEKAKTKYNNMLLQKTWNKQDSKDAKVIALATRCEK